MQVKLKLHWVRSPIPLGCVTNRVVNTQLTIVGLWSFICNSACTTAKIYYRTM